ncbi:MAG: SpoIID/LytB domain-containing protein, partial [Armatimonadota bacterium]|nr:SpoIID/LytB domain-containing protein [Armatimonadota bacterium]
LLLDQDLVTIASTGPVDLVDVAADRRVGRGGGRLLFRAAAAGIEHEGAVYAGPLRVEPRASPLQVNGRPYRGAVEVRRAAGGRLTVINEVGMEEYLYGVVRSEMDPRWPAEALRAQAVAARSLAAVGSGRFAVEGYDVRATTDSQVYGGIAAEDPRTSAAVDATRGLVILYDGRPAFAAYHADSGGATENSEHVWGSVVPHLRGVPDPFSRDAPNHEWTVRLEFGAIEAALQRAGRPVAGLQAIEVTSTSPSGRALTVRLQTTGGAVEMRGAEFRLAVGAGVVRSTLFAVRALGGDAVELAGRGSGHGVGLSQWGARGMALAGRDHAAILRHFYTGVTVGPRP